MQQPHPAKGLNKQHSSWGCSTSLGAWFSTLGAGEVAVLEVVEGIVDVWIDDTGTKNYIHIYTRYPSKTTEILQT